MTTTSSQTNDFADLLNCMICLSEANDPHVCPKCSKIVCYKCIEQWLRGESMFNKCCPNCKAIVLQVNSFVKIRWFDDIKKCIETSRNCQIDDGNCNDHNKKMVMFCRECEELVCIDCVNGFHQFHNFQEIEETYNVKIKKMERKIMRLNRKSRKLVAWKSDIKERLTKINNVKKTEIEDYKTEIEKKRFDLQFEYEWKLNQLNQDLDFKEKDTHALYKDTIFQLERVGKKVEDELEEIRRVKRKFEDAKTQPRASFIDQSDSLQNYCYALVSEEIELDTEDLVEPSLTKTTEFVLKTASTLNNSGVYSDVAKDYYGHSWRLLIKKNTSGSGIAVNIHCTSGDPSWQECRIQVVHHITGEIYQQKFYHYFNADKKICGFPLFMSAQDFDKFTNKIKDTVKFYFHVKPHQPDELVVTEDI